MEENAGRSTTTVGFLRRGSGVSLRNQSNEERPNKCNNKPGNTTKMNPTKARWAENKEQPRYLHDSFRSSGSKSISVSSSKAPVRKNFEEKPRRPFSAQLNNAESSNRRTVANRPQSSKKSLVDEEGGDPSAQQIESEDSLSTSTTEEDQPTELDPEVTNSSVSSGSSPHAVDSVVRNTASRTKPRRQKDKEEFSFGRPQTASTSVHQPTVPRNSAFGVKSSNGPGPGIQRRGIKNLGCTSISDVLPSGCSSSNSVHSKRAEITRKRASDAETSSRLRGLNGQSSLGPSPSLYPGSTGSRVRASEQASQQTTRTSNRIIRDSAYSERNRLPSTQNARMGMQDETEHGAFALRETFPRVRQPDWAQFSLDEVPPQRSARPFPMELPHAIYSSSRQGSSNRTTRSRPSSRPEDSSPQMFRSLLGERDVYRRMNMDGIAEVLLALDRIEHDDELSYEQLLVLETNLFLSGIGLHDQHRDMRMDIDEMSYEELLQLEDRIGSVSTALSEEQFAKHVSRNVYKRTDRVREVNREVIDDIKCSICQEEYIEGEEVGRMKCEHQYHVCCIQEWLRQKNWCPICKASAIPSDMDKKEHT